MRGASEHAPEVPPQLRRQGGRVAGVPAGIAAAEAERERLGCRMPSYIKHLESELGLEGVACKGKGPCLSSL